jgi:hypothetical protein
MLNKLKLLGLGFFGSILALKTEILAFAQTTLTDFQLINIGCLIPVSGCKGPSLIEIGIDTLKGIAPYICTLVIMWGGYQYFLGELTGQKKKGIEAVQAGVVGFAVVLLADAIGGQKGFVVQLFQGGKFNSAVIINFINNNLIGLLTTLAVSTATLSIIVGAYKDFLKSFKSDNGAFQSATNAIIGLSIVFVSLALSKTVGDALGGGKSNDINIVFNGVGNLVRTLFGSSISLLTSLGGIMATFVIVFGGYQYYAGATIGSKTDGIKTVQTGVVGLIFIMISRGVTELVQAIFGNPSNKGDSFFKFSDFGNPNSAFYKQIVGLIGNGVSSLIYLSSVVAVAVVVYGGYQFFQGGIDGKTQGKETVVKGVSGLVVVILARPIVNIASQLLVVSNNAYTLGVNTAGIITIIQYVLGVVLIPLSAIVTVFLFVLGGYRVLTARGDSAVVKKGYDTLQNALIGLVIVLFASTVSQLVVYFINSFVTTSV